MFGIIIATLAIMLIILVVVVTSHYGGDVFTRGNEEAGVAKTMNQLGQIKAAVVSHIAHEGAEPDSVESLVPKYLSSVPKGWGVEGTGLASLTTFESTRVARNGDEAEELRACNDINRRLNPEITTPPSCTDLPKNFSGCCVAP